MARKGSALRHRKHSTTEKKRKASLPRDIKYELKRMGQKETDIREAVQALRSADSPARSPLSPGCSLPTPGVKLVPIAGAGRSPSKTPRKKDKKNVKLSKSMQPQRPNQSPNDSRRWGPSIRRTKITVVSSPLRQAPQLSPKKKRRHTDPDPSKAEDEDPAQNAHIPDSVGWTLEAHPKTKPNRSVARKRGSPRRRTKRKTQRKASYNFKALNSELRRAVPEVKPAPQECGVESAVALDENYQHLNAMLEEAQTQAQGTQIAACGAWRSRLLGDCAVQKAQFRHVQDEPTEAWNFAMSAGEYYKKYIQSKYFHALSSSVEYSVQDKKDNIDRVMALLQLKNQVFHPYVTWLLETGQNFQAANNFRQASECTGIILESFTHMDLFFKDKTLMSLMSSVFVKSQLKMKRASMERNADVLESATAMRQWAYQAVTAECNAVAVSQAAVAASRSLSKRASKQATRAACRKAAAVCAKAVYEIQLTYSIAQTQASRLFCVTLARNTVAETEAFMKAHLEMRLAKAKKIANLASLYSEKCTLLAAGMVVVAGARISAVACFQKANAEVASATAQHSFITATQSCIAATVSASECVQNIMSHKYKYAVHCKAIGRYTSALEHIAELDGHSLDDRSAEQLHDPSIWVLRVWLRKALQADREACRIASYANAVCAKDVAAAEARVAQLVCREYARAKIAAAEAKVSSVHCGMVARDFTSRAEARVVNIMSEHLGTSRNLERQEFYADALDQLTVWDNTTALDIYGAMQESFFNPPHSKAIEHCHSVTFSCLANDSSIRDTRALQLWLQTVLNAEANAAAAAAMAVSRAHSLVLPACLAVLRAVVSLAVDAAEEAAESAQDNADMIAMQYEAAVMIQTRRRAQQGFRKVIKVRKMLKASIVIQAYERGRRARELASGKTAAKICRMACRIAFRAVPAAFRALAVAEAKVATVVCFQAANYCCFYSREQVATIELAIIMQALGRGYNQRAYFKIAEAMHKAAKAARGASKSCGFVAREAQAAAFEATALRKEQDEGATRMQALARGNMFRKKQGSRMAVEKAARVAAQAAGFCQLARARAAAAAEEAIGVRAEFDSAVVKVQSLTRGHIGRKQFQEATEASRAAVVAAIEAATAAGVIRVSMVQLEDDLVEALSEQTDAANKLQKTGRGMLGRKKAALQKAKVHAADVAHDAADAALAADNAAAVSAKHALVVDDRNTKMRIEAVTHAHDIQHEEHPQE